MPIKNGITVVHEIREYYKSKQKDTQLNIKLPYIVFLTAYKSNVLMNHLMKLNITQCYEKPL